MKEELCRDAILWIGRSYSEILCNSKPELLSNYCYKDNNGKHRCYVHEAEMRGCCRKIPKEVNWLIPGKSRIFLMYREDKLPEHGSIFGYFVFKRFEHIVSGKIDYDITRKNVIPWIDSVCQEIISAVLIKIEEKGINEIRGSDKELIEDTLNKEFDRYWVKGVKNQSRKGHGIHSKAKPKSSPKWPSNKDLLNDTLTDFLEDLLEEQIRNWVKDQIKKYREHYGTTPEDIDEVIGDLEHESIPITNSILEESRYCSKRLKVGAIYVVDALTASITDEFAKRLSKKRPVILSDGEKLFRDTIISVRNGYTSGKLTKIIEDLKSFSTMHGELVVFKPPYPVFQRKPKADFRGLLCVDGKQLLMEITNHYKKPMKKGSHIIPFLGVDENILDPVFMAQSFGITKRMARAILTLYGKSIKLLKKGEQLKLNKIGVIERTNKYFIFKDA